MKQKYKNIILDKILYKLLQKYKKKIIYHKDFFEINLIDYTICYNKYYLSLYTKQHIFNVSIYEPIISTNIDLDNLKLLTYKGYYDFRRELENITNILFRNVNDIMVKYN